MSTRRNLAGTSVLPFQFPWLKDGDAAMSESIIPVLGPALPPDTRTASIPLPRNGAAHPANGEVRSDPGVPAELAAARAEGLLRGFEEGREKGHAAGFAEGVKAGEAKLIEEANRLAAIVARLSVPLTALEQPVEEAVAALSLEVARCVIGNEVGRSREFLVRLVREAIAKVPLEMGAPRIVLNPSDIELIRAQVPEIETGNATLVGDEAIELGGCLVVADGEDRSIKDRRWNVRAAEGVSQVNLTLSSRWRAVMLTLFDGEDQ